MRHLWQRIFAYSLLLILITQVAILHLHNYTRNQDSLRRFVAGSLSALADAVQDRGSSTAERVLGIFNQNSARAWIVDTDGVVLAGQANAAVTLPASPAEAPGYWQDGKIELWRAGGRDSGFIGSVPVALRNGAGKLYVLFNPPRNNDTWNFFLLGLLALTSISGVLAFWMARAVSGPLRRLRAEVLEIAGSSPPHPAPHSTFHSRSRSPQQNGANGRHDHGQSQASPHGQSNTSPNTAPEAMAAPIKSNFAAHSAPQVEKRVTVEGQDEISDVALAVNHMADSLSRNVRSMRELVANVSHELRSPLARMQVALALLEESLPGMESNEESNGETDGNSYKKSGGKAAQKAALIQEELDHMEKLIGATLLSSKLDLQQLPPLSNLVAFSELCAEMARRGRPLFEKNRQIFRTEIEPGLAFKGDETLLCNLVSNLLDNAAKYTEAGGEVILRLCGQDAPHLNADHTPHADGQSLAPHLNTRFAPQRHENQTAPDADRQNTTVRLEVENTRSPASPLQPLSAEQLMSIFEPFNRAGLATGNGAGLGLALVKKIAELHGGRVRAANTAAGFCIEVEFAPES